jgi:hypothetical protein
MASSSGSTATSSGNQVKTHISRSRSPGRTRHDSALPALQRRPTQLSCSNTPGAATSGNIIIMDAVSSHTRTLWVETGSPEPSPSLDNNMLAGIRVAESVKLFLAKASTEKDSHQRDCGDGNRNMETCGGTDPEPIDPNDASLGPTPPSAAGSGSSTQQRPPLIRRRPPAPPPRPRSPLRRQRASAPAPSSGNSDNDNSEDKTEHGFRRNRSPVGRKKMQGWWLRNAKTPKAAALIIGAFVGAAHEQVFSKLSCTNT